MSFPIKSEGNDRGNIRGRKLQSNKRNGTASVGARYVANLLAPMYFLDGAYTEDESTKNGQRLLSFDHAKKTATPTARTARP